MVKLTYYGTVENGILKISNRKMYEKDISQYEGKRMELTIQKAKKKRSTVQNAYLWAVCYPMAKHGFEEIGEIGIDIDTIHRFFKDRFSDEYKQVVSPISGEVITLQKTTTTMSTTQMMTYIEQVAKFCSDFLGIVIPPPDPLFSINETEI